MRVVESPVEGSLTISNLKRFEILAANLLNP
jgi:hypothetical protein